MAIAGVSLALAGTGCADEPAGELDGPRLLAAEFTEEFHVGDERSERQFVRVTSMAFAPNGHLVVTDRDAFAVMVFDEGGREVAAWGGEGDGPGEFANEPNNVAVFHELRVAVRSFRRVDVFTLGGELIGSHLLDTLTARTLAFSREGDVVARVEAPSLALLPFSSGEATATHIMRLRDRRVLWSSRPLQPVPLLRFWSPHIQLAGIGDGRIAVGMSDQYHMDVLDASDGTTLGRISRAVSARGPSEDFQDNMREQMRGMESDPAMRELIDDMTFVETFPILGSVFAGPPGRTVWVRRGMGVGDALAPPASDDINDWTHRLYDLFDGDDYAYIGTVELPEDLTLMAGDSERVAGVHTDPLGVHSVRVLRLELPGGHSTAVSPKRARNSTAPGPRTPLHRQRGTG